MTVNVVYVILAAAISLLMLPLLLAVILTLGPVVFVLLLVAAFALPIYLGAAAGLRRNRR